MKNLTRQIAISAAAIALAAVMVGKASAEVITFDALPAGAFTTFTDGAFTVTANPGNPGDNPTIVNVGGTNQNVVVDGNLNDPFGTAFTVTETDGGLFSLNSVDVADLLNPGGGSEGGCAGGGLRIEATGGGACTDFNPGSSTFTTVSPAGFSNISSLTINIVSAAGFDDYAVDNINLTASPEPSTLILAFGGLVGLGVSAQRRRARG
jgi:hypothetical protein